MRRGRGEEREREEILFADLLSLSHLPITLFISFACAALGHHGRFLVVTSSGRTYDFHTLLPKQASHIHFITSQLWLRCLEAESGVAPRGNSKNIFF